MKTIYIVKNFKNFEEIKKIKINSNNLIYSLDDSTSEYLVNQSIEFKETKYFLLADEIRSIEWDVTKIVTEWYRHKEICEELLIEKINLGFLVELELFNFLVTVIKNIKIIEKIVEYEKPDKIITFGKVDNVNFVATKYKIKCDTPTKSNLDKLFFMNQVEVRYDIFNHNVGFVISQEKYLLLREKFEKCTNFILKLLNTKNKTKKNFLLLEFNISLFPELINISKKMNCKLNFLNVRRPVVWSLKSFNLLRNSNSKVLIFNDYLKNKNIIDEQIIGLEKKLKKIFEKEEILSEIFSINNKSYWSEIEKSLFNFLRTRGIQAIKEIQVSKKIFETNDIDVVLGLNDNIQTEKTILSIAKQKGIPSVILQHGMFNNKQSKNEPWFRINAILPLVADYFAVWGKIVKDFAMKNGFELENISIVGGPKFDSIFQRPKKKRKTNKILLTTQSIWADLDYEGYKKYRNAIKRTCEIVKNLEGYELVVKVHPYQQELKMISNIIKNVEPATPIFVNSDIDELIESCDIVITFNLSTVILHSLIAKKPTIVWCLDERVNDRVLFDYGGVVLLDYTGSEFYQEKEMKYAIEKIIKDEKYVEKLIDNGTKYINEYFSYQGNASEELLKFLGSLYKNSD